MKRRLSLTEIKTLLDGIKQYGAYHTIYIDHHTYGIDDVYDQFLWLHDAVTSLVIEHLLLRKG